MTKDHCIDLGGATLWLDLPRPPVGVLGPTSCGLISAVACGILRPQTLVWAASSVADSFDDETLRDARCCTGIKRAVVSNFDTRLRPILDGLGLSELFDVVIVSAGTSVLLPGLLGH